MHTDNIAHPRNIDPLVLRACEKLILLGLTTPRGVADIFVVWSPHVDLFDVSVIVGGWKSGSRTRHPSFSVLLKAANAADLLQIALHEVEKTLTERIKILSLTGTK